MNDYKGSVAQQDIDITTEVLQTAVVGGNFYQGILYVTNRFKTFEEGVTPVYPMVTSDDYADVLDAYNYLDSSEKAIIKANLASLFTYGSPKVYIVPPEAYANYKMKGYFMYLDIEWNTAQTSGEGAGKADYAPSTKGNALLEYFRANAIDSAFNALLAEVPVDTTKVSGIDTESTSETIKALTAYGLKLGCFARGATAGGGTAAGTKNAYLDAEGSLISDSPALYQLGKTLAVVNGSGTPIGNGWDMNAVTLAAVLPSASTDSSEVEGASASFVAVFDSNHVNYFKPVGNGTGQITNVGGWTTLNTCIGAEWMVAYMNFINRCKCASIITDGGRALKNSRTYNTIIEALKDTASTMAKSERITGFSITAPGWGELPVTDGHTITIPNAWTAYYLDNVRKVNISGSIVVNG